MTDWIDKFAERLSDSQKELVRSQQISLLHDEIIKSRGRDFFNELVTQVAKLAKELHEKLSPIVGDADGVKFASGPDSFSVEADARSAVAKAAVKLNLKAHDIRLEFTLRGSPFIGYGGEVKHATFTVGAGDELCIAFNGRQYTPGNESHLASAILQETFTEAFIDHAIKSNRL